jgi:lysophospholipase L1-like esterase
MKNPRALVVALACLCVGASACTATHSSAASDGGAPQSTIGLGFEFDLEPGAVSGVADVRAVDAEQIDTVVMIGDSLTVASKPALEQRFAELGFDNVLIEAETGKRMTSSDGSNSSGEAIANYLANVDSQSDRSNELWIVALGTNDVNQYADVGQIATQVDEVLAAVPDDAAVVWVDTYIRQDQEGSDEVNVAITDRVAARGNAVVAPWSAYAGGDGVLSGDGYHPSPDGRQVFADVVAGTVSTFLSS